MAHTFGPYFHLSCMSLKGGGALEERAFGVCPNSSGLYRRLLRPTFALLRWSRCNVFKFPLTPPPPGNLKTFSNFPPRELENVFKFPPAI